MEKRKGEDKKSFASKKVLGSEVAGTHFPAGVRQARPGGSGDSGDRTRDLSHPKRESYR